ncbi:cystathionine gamma-synthase [Mytilinidion resinicola]|uniref:cystathionine gamma-synthase n=1 Tax=Mytilinidion resinicola TaxID=574789 RepID=A0A6A6YZ00_9PEZI|nr:cystathionine gamma-synthase [Mytilinidion resinicola]KAF2814051.1 cystathionine gamma-synthase [Mytilinidion resinicola]
MTVSMAEDPANDVGESIPAMTAHAVSVSLPTWKANVGYEEGEEWVMSKMKTGYPRFFIHKSIQKLAAAIVQKYGRPGEAAFLFPSNAVASRCLAFFNRQAPQLDPQKVRIVDLGPAAPAAGSRATEEVSPSISAVIFPQEHFSVAKAYWQHSGDGISSRRADYCFNLFSKGLLVDLRKQEEPRFCKGPKRYQKKTSVDITGHSNGVDSVTKGTGDEVQDPTRFVEERFGRNLDLSLAANAKLAIRRRIAGSLTADVGLTEALSLERDEETTRKVAGFSEDDVYLYPTGMSSIFNSHRTLLAARGELKSIIFGFPYVDTLKIVQKFGPGCLFYGFGSAEDLDDLEKRLAGGEKYLALFTEFPGNPLLKSPDLQRIRTLADTYDFAVVIDETVGNFLNVNVLPYSDVVVSSLTKVFSGDSNVMGGSAILNPKGRHFQVLKDTWESEYEDNHWAEDSVFLERNSRDFVPRIARINANAEAICDVLRAHPRVKQVNYPKYSPTRPFYDQCRNPNGGYGGLLSATFYSTADAVAFFDHIDTAKGPSLGTNFTLSSPYVILAHYSELDWAASFGVETDLVRFSVGLEDTKELVDTFERALEAIPQ